MDVRPRLPYTIVVIVCPCSPQQESDCYQHVTESQASDAVAWDTAEAGVSGLQEAAMEDEDDDRENGQEGADEIGEEKASYIGHVLHISTQCIY